MHVGLRDRPLLRGNSLWEKTRDLHPPRPPFTRDWPQEGWKASSSAGGQDNFKGHTALTSPSEITVSSGLCLKLTLPLAFPSCLLPPVIVVSYLLYFCVVCCDFSIFISNFVDLILLPFFLMSLANGLPIYIQMNALQAALSFLCTSNDFLHLSTSIYWETATQRCWAKYYINKEY